MPSRNSDFFHNFYTQGKRGVTHANYDTALRAYIQDMGGLPDPFDAETQKHLLARVTQGDKEAERLLVASNLRLVFRIASRYQWSGIALLDLIQVGNDGLLYAIQHFDESKSNTLSTYATIRVVHALGRYVHENANLVHTSYKTGQKIGRIAQVVGEFLERGVEPSVDDIAKQSGMKREEVVELLPIMRDPLRLDTPNEEGNPLHELLEDEPTLSSSTTAEVTSPLLAVLTQIDQVLPAKEGAVLKLRFGITDGIVYDYEEIAALLFPNRRGERTHDYVRSLEKQALAKIKAVFERNTDA